jgi:hypothetical protein
MKEIINNYIVSSAGWEINIDAENSRSAAISATILAFKIYNKSLLMSTIVMVNSESAGADSLDDVEFFATYEILGDLGLDKMSRDFLELTNSINEIKSIR